MKKITVSIRLFEKGDHVITPEGIGIIVEDEGIYNKTIDYVYGKVKVQHKKGYSNNPENSVVNMDRWTPSLITKESYDNRN